MTASTDDAEEEIKFGFDSARYGLNRQDLDALGERAVRDALNSGEYGHPGLAQFAFVSAWLADKDFARAEADSAKRDAREEETLSIARKASALAERANRIAWIAAVIAAPSIIKDIILDVFT